MLLIPGIGNAMRVNGRAYLEDDPVLLASFTAERVAPRIVMVISATRGLFSVCPRPDLLSPVAEGQSRGS
jgi:predicted pyridoxine 5'-phosphate oxidase superfamily flavin-nucleotide-binding protein